MVLLDCYNYNYDWPVLYCVVLCNYSSILHFAQGEKEDESILHKEVIKLLGNMVEVSLQTLLDLPLPVLLFGKN